MGSDPKRKWEDLKSKEQWGVVFNAGAFGRWHPQRGYTNILIYKRASPRLQLPPWAWCFGCGARETSFSLFYLTPPCKLGPRLRHTHCLDIASRLITPWQWECRWSSQRKVGNGQRKWGRQEELTPWVLEGVSKLITPANFWDEKLVSTSH